LEGKMEGEGKLRELTRGSTANIHAGTRPRWRNFLNAL
jgi:hypothetical protein